MPELAVTNGSNPDTDDVPQIPSTLERATRRVQTLALRAMGYTLVEIAERHEVDLKVAERDLDLALDSITRSLKAWSADNLRAMSSSRYEVAMRALVPSLESQSHHKRMQAIDRMVKIQDRLDKLFGLEMPKRIQVDATVGMPDPEELSDREIEDELRRLKAV